MQILVEINYFLWKIKINLIHRIHFRRIRLIYERRIVNQRCECVQNKSSTNRFSVLRRLDEWLEANRLAINI